MFNKLLNLYKKNSLKTPLEDFTTELFAGVLNNDKNLKLKFCKEFLGLKSERFTVNTQKHYSLEDYSNCIVDVVITGDKEICFIENKVNSNEGFLQLERYSKVLDKYEKENEYTKLVYCTKNADPKKIKAHSFFQCNWRNIAEFFKHNSTENITKLFINYLKINNMSNDMTITASDIVTLENISKILNLMNINLENVKQDFLKRFGNLKDLRKGAKLKEQIFNHERFCILSSPACEGEGWSEILYGFDFQGYIYVQIYLDNKNRNFNSFFKLINDQNKFKVEHYDFGSRIFLKKNLGEYLNEDNSETQIKKWFLESFDAIKSFIESTKKEIDWNKYVVQ